jgi:hypothetical protein
VGAVGVAPACPPVPVSDDLVVAAQRNQLIGIGADAVDHPCPMIEITAGGWSPAADSPVHMFDLTESYIVAKEVGRTVRFDGSADRRGPDQPSNALESRTRHSSGR